MPRNCLGWSLLVWASVAFGADAGSGDDAPAPDPFTIVEPLTFTLAGPLGALNDDRADREEMPGRISWSGEGGSGELAVQLRRRGNKRLEACDVNPVRLNFKRGDTEGTPFHGMDKIKLVTHCQRGGRFDAYVLREYLLYRIYALTTEQSFAVRLARITWRGSDTDRWDDERWGFLIEPDEQMVRRAGLELFEEGRVPRDALDETAALRVALFMYLIGNTDYSMVAGAVPDECCHNVQPTTDPDGRSVPVPYDFDMTGAVDPPYAHPPASLNLRSVRDRLFRGFCAAPERMQAARQQWLAVREEARALVMGFEPLDERDRERMWKYLDRGFDDLDSDRRFERQILRDCR